MSRNFQFNRRRGRRPTVTPPVVTRDRETEETGWQEMTESQSEAFFDLEMPGAGVELDPGSGNIREAGENDDSAELSDEFLENDLTAAARQAGRGQSYVFRFTDGESDMEDSSQDHNRRPREVQPRSHGQESTGDAGGLVRQFCVMIIFKFIFAPIY